MKKHSNHLTRLSRIITAGTTLGAALFAASALQAQTPSQTPSPGQTAPDQNPPAQNTTPPVASTEPSGKITHYSKEFLEDAAKANQTEIAMANVAQEKSQNAAVKSLSQMMLTDHQANYAQLQGLAQAHGINLDTTPGWVNDLSVNRLKRASDADFDKVYTRDMVKDHVDAIKIFDKAVTKADEQDVRQYAQDTLPKLREHLRKSEEAARTVGVDDSTISSILKGLPAQEPDRGITANQ